MVKEVKDTKQKNEIKKQDLLHLWSLEKAEKEGLYFPKRRIRIENPSKISILERIESQNFKGATEEEIIGYKLYFTVLLNNILYIPAKWTNVG